MKQAIIFFVLALLAALSTGQLTARVEHVPDYAGRSPTEHPILAECSRFDRRYDALGFRTSSILTWPDEYHKNVNAVIEEYMGPLKLKCDAGSYEALLQPGTALQSLARSLPSWNDPRVVVSRFDTPRVLLEYLRVYECALHEFDTFSLLMTREEEFAELVESYGGDVDVALANWEYQFPDLAQDSAQRTNLITKELDLARRTLTRTLSMMSAYERLKPLEAELECMQRMSLDARNIAALMAETSSCLPRVWNAKDPLRDYKEKP